MQSIVSGTRVKLTKDYRFVDMGDTGRVLHVDPVNGIARVALDGGAQEAIPVDLLTAHIGEFYYRVRGGGLSRSYSCEDAASEAAEALGLLEWDVVEIRHVSRNTIEYTDACPAEGDAVH